MHGRQKIRIGFLVVLVEQGELSNSVEKGLGGYPYIPSIVIKCQTLKDPLSFRPSLLSSLRLTPSPLISLERRDYWHTGIQKWHLLKIKRLSQAANLMRVAGGWGE